MPFFSIVAMSASITEPILHSAMKACSSALFFAACVAIGCSAATAQNVTPMIVSGRVVNTNILPSPISAPSSPLIWCGNAKRTPVDLPIQFDCMMRTRSGQPGSLLSTKSSSSSA